MSNDLKKENNQPIFLILMGALLLSAGFQLGFDHLPALTEAALAGTASILFSAVLIMITNLIPHDIKHKLVFTRFTNEMPAGRIIKLTASDPRIDIDMAKAKWPDVYDESISEDQRNRLWYKQIYKPVKNRDEVLQAHRSFLLYRDVFSGLFTILIGLLIWHWWGDQTLLGPLKDSVFITIGLFTLLSMLAARTSGNRFVINAVATAL